MRVVSLLVYMSIFIVPCFNSLYAQNPKLELTAEEKQLYELIMNYRTQKHLPAIPLSSNLTVVAQTHAKDLHENRPFNKKCNMHSWSRKGEWKACCYTSDHKNAECMWDKPRELTSYKGDGFEIAHGFANYDKYQGVDVTPETALDGWKKSKGHNQVIVNLGIWKDVEWQAIGIGIYKDFAVVWFGREKDETGNPELK